VILIPNFKKDPELDERRTEAGMKNAECTFELQKRKRIMYYDGICSLVSAGFRRCGIAYDKFPLSSTLVVSVESGAERPRPLATHDQCAALIFEGWAICLNSACTSLNGCHVLLQSFKAIFERLETKMVFVYS
jgi:hypothetical protein